MQPNNTHLTSTKFNFDGDTLAVVPISSDDVGVCLRRLSEACGVGADAQVKRVARAAAKGARWARTFKMNVRDERGQVQEMVVLPRRSIPMWAATISLGHVREEARTGIMAKVTAYQDDCAEVLADHFLGRRGMGLSARAAGEQIEALRHRNAILEAQIELLAGQGPGVIGKLRATTWILGLLRAAARINCAAANKHTKGAFGRAFKDAENQCRLHVHFPPSSAQRWENLPLDKFGDASDKALEILERAKRDARRAGHPDGSGGGQSDLFVTT